MSIPLESSIKEAKAAGYVLGDEELVKRQFEGLVKCMRDGTEPDGMARQIGGWSDVPTGEYNDCRFKLVHESGPMIVPFKAIKPYGRLLVAGQRAVVVGKSGYYRHSKAPFVQSVFNAPPTRDDDAN